MMLEFEKESLYSFYFVSTPGLIEALSLCLEAESNFLFISSFK